MLSPFGFLCKQKTWEQYVNEHPSENDDEKRTCVEHKKIVAYFIVSEMTAKNKYFVAQSDTRVPVTSECTRRCTRNFRPRFIF